MSNAKAFDDAVSRGERRSPAELEQRLPCGLNLLGGEGFVTVETERSGLQDSGDFEWVLTHYGLNPELYEVDESYPVEIGSWQMGYTKRIKVEELDPETDELVWVNQSMAEAKDLFRYKVKIRKRRPGDRLNSEHVDEMISRVRKRRKIDPSNKRQGLPLIANISDLQVGKGDYGGTQALIDRCEQAAANLKALVKEQRPSRLVIADLGDATEGCQGFYPDQTWRVDLNNTEQLRLATEIFHEMLLDPILNMVPDIHMVFVPSNHGEFRVGKGNTVTDRARDNADLVIADNIARVCRSNTDRYGHVNVWTPPSEDGDPYVVTLDVDGVMLAWTHGHQMNGGAGNRMGAIEKWWQAQRWSDRTRPGTETLPTAADADILNVGHGHHFLASQRTGRLAMQMPAMENGSEAFTTATGLRSSAGWCAYTVSSTLPAMADNFRYL